MSKKSVSYGASERTKKRKERVQNVRDKTEVLIAQYLPGLKLEIPNTADYSVGLESLLKTLETEFRAMVDFRDARNYLARIINQGNESKKWSLDVPPYINRLRRDEPLRTQHWFENTKTLSGLHQHWFASITNIELPTNHESEKEIEERTLSDALISASLHGGLCRPREIICLANTLLHEDRPLIGSDNIVWIDLLTGNDDGVAIRRWYPDIISLICIHKFLTVKQVRDHLSFLTSGRCWALISGRLADITKAKVSLSFLSFCRSAVGITENLPGVELPQVYVEYAIGRVSATSLPAEFMLGLFQTKFESLGKLSLDGFKHIPSQARGTLVRKTQIECNYSALIKEVNKALAVFQRPSVKNTPRVALTNLGIISKSSSYPFSVQILLDWLMSLLATPRAVSTVRRYFTEIGKSWLISSMDFDFNSIDAADLENLYTSLFDHELSPTQSSYRAGRVRQFYEYCVSEFEFPVLDDSMFAEFGYEQSKVRPGFITEALFCQLCISIRHIDGFDAETVNGLICMLIICYRTGLRRGEALKIRLCDIESSSDMWLYVRVNIHGENKNWNATRKIPLAILLTEEERAIIGDYVGERRVRLKGKNTHLLFSMPHTTNVPHDSNQISLIVNYILRSLAPIDLTFHHLRHSALCKLQAVVEKDTELIQLLTPYDDEQAAKIRKALVSFNDDFMHKDSYYAISSLAGHATPAMTFHSYFHFSDWVLGHRLSRSTIALTAAAFKKMSGISSSAITRECKKHGWNTANLAIKDLRSLTIKKLKSNIEPIYLQKSDCSVSSPEGSSHTEKKPNMSISICYAALKEYEKGVSIADLIYKLHLPESALVTYVGCAKALYNLKTEKGVPRLFSSYRVGAKTGVVITPSQPNWKSEQLEMEGAIDNCRPIAKKSRGELIWCLEYFLSNNNMSNTGLTFRDHDDFKRFMNVFLKVFPAKRWRVYVSPRKGDKKISQHIKIWKSASPQSEFLINELYVKNEKLYPVGKAELFLTHPDESTLKKLRKKQSITKYSASNLRYLLHMLSIMLLTAERIRALPSYREFD